MKFYEYLRSIEFKPLPKTDQVQFVCDSLEEGLTVPFLARYRQPQTGGLQGNELRLFERSLKHYKDIESLRAKCLQIIEEQPQATTTWKNFGLAYTSVFQFFFLCLMLQWQVSIANGLIERELFSLG